MAIGQIKRNQSQRRQPWRPDLIRSFIVEQPDELMHFLINAMPEKKRTNIKDLLSHNQVMINGAIFRQYNAPLQPGDEVKVNFSREWRTFNHRRIKLVYEDDDIIVVNKGYGLLSMGTDRVKDGTAYSILKEWVKWQNPTNKIFIVHRLDRDTSGLMMFAKTQEAKEIMQHNWNNMVLNRKYLAVVEGAPEQAQGTVKSYLVENSRYEVYSSPEPIEGGQYAVTRYTTLKEKNGYALLEVELDTGRKNQIRVHMKDLGHPISGDRKYGAQSSPIHRLALHAQTLRFIHPITRKEMNFATAIPAPFAAMVR